MKVSISQSMIFTAKSGVDIDTFVHQQLHPSDDVRDVAPSSKTPGTIPKISVEDIRDCIHQIRTKSKNIRTVVIFSQAHMMTEQAQNALLKTLEEPRDNLFILLSTSHVSGLLPTVLSRCQIYTIDSKNRGDVVVPEELKSQVAFMSGGVQDEITKLVTDEQYLASMQDIFSQAKQFIGADSYQKIALIAKLEKRPREEVLHFLSAVMRILNAILQNQFSSTALQSLERFVTADESIRMNGNIRIQLLRTVI